jgi:glycopeptide antibiotics resistance protein
VEFGGNVLMFVPFGVLVAIAATRRCLWLAPASAFAVSGIFEVLQAMTLPSRTPDARDVIAATIGAFVGAVAGWAIPATRRTPPSIASQGPRSGT